MREKTLLYSALGVTAVAAALGIYHAKSLSTDTNKGTELPITPVNLVDAKSRTVATAEVPIKLTASDGTGLKLVALKAEAAVEDPLALTELHLTFENPEDRILEGTFNITLPQGATLSRFAMKVGEVWQEGEVVEKQAARVAYEDFLHRRQDPALMEQGAGNEFSARVFPIPARGTKEIILTYSESLEVGAPYVLPLRGLAQLGNLDVNVHVAGKNASADGKSDALYGVHQTAFTPGSDFVVDSRQLPRSPGLRAGNLAIARVVPFATSRPDPLLSAVILVDTSASRGLGIGEQARAVKAMIAKLPSDASVSVACFDQDVSPLYEGKAGGFGDKEVEAIIKRGALGASDFEGALAWAGGEAKKKKRSRVVWITDGVATAGETDAQKLKTQVEALRDAGITRMDAVAMGGIRDDAFLRTVVRGVLDKDGVVLDAKVGPEALARRLGEMTSSGVPVKVAGARWSYPQTLDGLQSGDEVLVYAEMDGGAPLTLDIAGQPFTPDLRTIDRPLVERAWAQAKIQSLLEQPKDNAAATKAEIIHLSTSHRVLSPYTALLVLENDQDYRRFNIDRHAKVDILTVAQGKVAVTESGRVTTDEAEKQTAALAAQKSGTAGSVDEKKAEPKKDEGGGWFGWGRKGASEPSDTAATPAAPPAASFAATTPAPPLPPSVPGTLDPQVNAAPAGPRGGVSGNGGSPVLTTTPPADGYAAASPQQGQVPAVMPAPVLPPPEAERNRDLSVTPEAKTVRPRPARAPARVVDTDAEDRPAKKRAPAGPRRDPDEETRNALEELRKAQLEGALGSDRPEPAPPPAATTSPRPAPRPAVVARPRPTDCSTPYWFDATGVKHYKPECVDDARTHSVTGQVRASSLSVDHGIGSDEVQRVIRGAIPRYRSCYQAGLDSDPTMGGTIAFSVRLDKLGAVTFVTASGSNASTSVRSCMETVTRSLRFPAPGSGDAAFTQSLDLVGGGMPIANGESQPNSNIPQALPYEGRFKVVMDALSSNAKDTALDEATRWHADQPGDIMSLVALGEVLEARQELDQAARAYGSILELFSFRADSRRFAGERLERLKTQKALALAADTYGKAVEQRPDHPASHRLYAYALLKEGQPEKAFEAIKKGVQRTYPEGRFRGVDRILKEDMGLIAAAWMKKEPARKSEIVQRLHAAGGTDENSPSLRFVLVWETDANDVDFHIHDGKGGHAYYSTPNLPSGGDLYADVTTGYGPECFTIRNPKARNAYPYTLQAHYYSRGPMGYGMGKLEVLEHDGKGGISFQERPFVVMVDRAFVDMGTVDKNTKLTAM